VVTDPNGSLIPDAQVAAAAQGIQPFQPKCRSLNRVRKILGLFAV
jgi:hypothetical protein